METMEFSAHVARIARHFGMDLSRPLAMVSGGPDSVALARSLVELGSRPVVLHVDHGLRGEESREDAEFVRDLCGRLNLVYEERQAKLEGGNLQEEARRERYRFAEQVADERGLSVTATGHTADDVAETVLLNLARGAGLRGLSGIPPVRGRVVRPLIRHRRCDVLRYLEYLGQPYRTDSTNLTPKYARNRVRLEVMPVLEELYPGAGENVARTASLLREDLEALEDLVGGLIRRREDEVAVPLDELRRAPPALRRYSIREAYSVVAPDATPLGSAAVEGILELAWGGERTREMHLPALVTAVVRSGQQEELVLYRKRGKVYAGERDLLPGTQSFERWIVEVREVRGFDPTDAARPEVAYLDASVGPYRVRMAREGDTIRPLGLGGTKKVYKAMKDRKVPRDLRARTPVVIDGQGRVAWVFTGELGEAFGVETKTTRVLRVEVERTP
jgi:tRNA(Ile)-lysidine synthase